MAGLIRYDAACRALREAASYDEVKEIRDLAIAAQHYARQAKNRNLEIDAAEIRMRAEHRLGEIELLREKAKGQLLRGSEMEPREETPTLADLGISKKLAASAQALARAYPTDDAFEERLAQWREEVAQDGFVSTRLLPDAKAEKRAEREAVLATKIKALPDTRFGVILADPPWRFEVRSERGMDRSADNHYPTLTLHDIQKLDVPSLAAESCVLFLWTTPPFLAAALVIGAVWQFDYKTNLVWDKGRVGTGYWFRQRHEHLLVFTRGDVPAPTMGTQSDSVINALPGKHSQKPPKVHELIEKYFPTIPKIELFRRGKPRPGWSAWGAEAEDA